MSDLDFVQKLDKILEPLAEKDAFLSYDYFSEYVWLVAERALTREEALKQTKGKVDEYLRKHKENFPDYNKIINKSYEAKLKKPNPVETDKLAFIMFLIIIIISYLFGL